MIIVDTALARRAEENNPIQVGLVGAGYMAQCIALQIVSATPGMRLAAVSNRTVEKASDLYKGVGIDGVSRVDSAAALEESISNGQFCVTDDPSVITSAGPIEAVIEVTGDVETGTRVAFNAINNGKHVILLNAEVDGSVGPILKVYADRAGVVYTYTDGDEPGVAMNLYRQVASMGCKPVMVGQLKGFLNRYRNPETQEEFAKTHQVTAAVVASFADGSKLALEAAIMGNATGFVPSVRGMKGDEVDHVNDLVDKYSVEDFNEEGFVEYALGAAPHTGAFVMVHNEDLVRRKLMSYLKMGAGPLHMFYTPYHLPPMQLPHSVARAVLFNDPTITPRDGAPTCDTIAFAKKDLAAGEKLDGMGGFTCYGMIDRYDTCRQGDFLPMAISIDCTMKRAVSKDQPLTYEDVELPEGRLSDKLRAEMIERFM